MYAVYDVCLIPASWLIYSNKGCCCNTQWWNQFSSFRM